MKARIEQTGVIINPDGSKLKVVVVEWEDGSRIELTLPMSASLKDVVEKVKAKEIKKPQKLVLEKTMEEVEVES